jgi:predicted nuclease of predicted toxin-antitoxin system
MTPRGPLIVDAQLPHVADRNMEAASDAGIWDFALQAPMAIIMEDEDFAQRKVPAEGGPVVIWMRLPNTRRQALLAWFEEVLPDVLAAMERGDTLIEVI